MQKLLTVLAAVLAVAALPVLPAVAQAAEPPFVTTDGASAVTQTSATLEAHVDPNGETVSDCHFEYGTTISYGSSASCAHLPGSGSSPVFVSASVTGLTARTTYHFRIVATNPTGTSFGNDRTITTPVPHYYQNGRLVPAGEQVPILEWGTLSFEGDLYDATCETTAAGFIENPEGGGPGTAQISSFASWNCTNPECPPGEVEFEGHNYEKEYEVIAPPQDLPWSSVLTELEPKVVKSNITGLVLEFGCVLHTLTKAAAEGKPPPAPGEDEQYPLSPFFSCTTTAHYELSPKQENGTNKGPGQSKLVISYENGKGRTLLCVEAVLEVAGAFKFMGYEGSELITVK